MNYRLSIIFISLILGLSFRAEALYQNQDSELQQSQSSEQERGYFVLDPETLDFVELQKTPATVDSLLDYGISMRNRDARITYHVAREALALAKEIGYLEGEGRAHNLTGIKYLDFGEYELAMNHYLAALEIEYQLENEVGIATLLSNIGLIHLEQTNYDKATEFLLESIERMENLGQYNENYQNYNNLGVIYRRKGEYDRALDYFFEAKKLSMELEEPDSLIYFIASLNIGNTYRNMGELEEGSGYLYEADEFFSRRGMRGSQSITNLVLGQLHQDLDENEIALDYAFKSLEFAQEAIQRERIKDAYELIAELYESMGQFEEAYQNYRLYHAVSDSLLNIQRADRIDELQIQFEVEQKDREIMLLNREAELQQARIAQQNQLKYFLIGGLVLLLAIAGLLLYFNIIRKKNNQLLSARRKQIEYQNEKLALLNKDKDNFLSMAAHDLKNPLSAIKTAVDLIQSDQVISRDELNDYLEMILISSDRMISLISDLLKIQSIDDRDSADSTEYVSVNSALQHSLSNYDHPAQNKKITLHSHKSDDPDMIVGNSSNLIRIFDNLLSNAIKYSPHGSNVYTSTERKGDSIIITIRDEGPGFKSEEQTKLFNKFARMSNQPTGSETSTGLGLYIVKRLVESMNGRVWCESERGEGSAFYIEFPLATQANDETTPAIEEPESAQASGTPQSV